MTYLSPNILAWHFVAERLRDGRPIPPDGKTLRHDGPLILCVSGLHASKRIIDALTYAPGETLCRVSCGGEAVQDTDKLICRERTILWRMDVSALLREFAHLCALDVVHLWSDQEIVLDYLRTGDETKRTAVRAIAWAAANADANAAANAAAWATARAAAKATAWAAAGTAAWAVRAARAAAWAAANADAKDAAGAAAKATAWAVASAAARDAARNAQNKRLAEMVARAAEDKGLPI